MKITYDPEANAAFIHLVDIAPGGVAYDVPLEALAHESVALHSITLAFNRDHQLLGIEILDAARHLPQTVLEAAEPASAD